MTLRILGLRHWPFVAVGVVCAASSAFAEVTRVDIERREDVLNGKTFGSAGPYEKLIGRVHFAVDPKNPHNQIIADIDKAPRNAEGKVEFSSDLYIIKPKDPSKGNGVVFFDIVNRGNKHISVYRGRNEQYNNELFDSELFTCFGHLYIARGRGCVWNGNDNRKRQQHDFE